MKRSIERGGNVAALGSSCDIMKTFKKCLGPIGRGKPAGKGRGEGKWTVISA